MKTLKTILMMILCLSLAASMVACASIKSEPTDETIDGGWSTGEPTELTDEQKALFEKALDGMAAALKTEAPADGQAAFKLLKADFDKRAAALKTQAADAGKKLSNVFAFCEAVFGGDSQEVLILVTELTISYYGARFISRYGCKEYFAHNKDLLFYERQKEIISQLDALDLELE